jgi:AcrR family transcriptional regulator
VKEAAGRSRKGEATRARILDAAKRVFEREGFHDARVTDIAEEAGLAAGALYHYFDSKEDVFRALARQHEERLVAPVDGAPGLASGFGREGIRLSIERYLQRYQEEAAILGVIEQVSRSDPEVNAVLIATLDEFVERSAHEIRRLQLEGIMDASLDPVMAADALGSMAARFAELWLAQGCRDYVFDVAVEQLSTLMANALGLAVEPS